MSQSPAPVPDAVNLSTCLPAAKLQSPRSLHRLNHARYDGDGRRVKKSDGTLYWVDDNFHPLEIGTASGLTKDFVFMGDRRIAFVSLASGNSYYYLPDHLGSTAVIASGDGKTIQWDADYYPFGNQRKIFTSLVNNPFQFTGDEYDSDTGFDYSIARFEAGKWGRFNSPDPYMGSMDLSNPQSLNRYAYVMNDPLNAVDPSGLDGDICDDPSIICIDPGEIQLLDPTGDPDFILVHWEQGPSGPVTPPADLFPGDGFFDPPPIPSLGFNVIDDSGRPIKGTSNRQSRGSDCSVNRALAAVPAQPQRE